MAEAIRETEARSRARRAGTAVPVATGILSIAAFLVIWQACVDAGWWNKLITPAPSAIVDGFASLVTDEGLIGSCLQTLAETAAAAVLASSIGIAIGLWLHRSRWAGKAYFTWFASVAAAPVVLLYPLFLVIFGRNAATIVA